MLRVRVPIYYMGNKFDLIDNLTQQFLSESEMGDDGVFYDVFGGSGNVALNVPYKNIVYNEANWRVHGLLQCLIATPCDRIISHIEEVIEAFSLYEGEEGDAGVLERGYYNFRDWFNKEYAKRSEGELCFSSPTYFLDLYTLTFFSFSNQIRFNGNGEFNMPFGKRCFSEESKYKIKLFKNVLDERLRKGELNLTLRCGDAFELLEELIKEKGDNLSPRFLYLDPPYLGTLAVYNEKKCSSSSSSSKDSSGWTEADDKRLFALLDKLTELKVPWAMSNVSEVRGVQSKGLLDWIESKGYFIVEFNDKNYASMGKGNAKAKEILVLNYEPKVKQFSIFDFL